MPAYGYVNFFKGKEPDCESLVITCIDFRFRKKIAELLNHSGCREFDILALPGSSKAVIDEQGRGVALNALDIAARLHGIVRVIVVDHIDCGAYGGSAAFSNPQEEKAFHLERLGEAADIIRNQCPSLEVVPAYIDWDKLELAVPITHDP